MDPLEPPPILATEAEYQATIIGAAQAFGWKVAHFRAARTVHGWRTPVEGDGKGFPDLFLVHPEAGLIWYVEVKRDDNRRLAPAQQNWKLWLLQAGGVHQVVLVPSGMDAFIHDLGAIPRGLMVAKRKAVLG